MKQKVVSAINIIFTLYLQNQLWLPPAGCGCVGLLNGEVIGEHSRKERKESQCQEGRNPGDSLTSFLMRKKSARAIE